MNGWPVRRGSATQRQLRDLLREVRRTLLSVRGSNRQVLWLRARRADPTPSRGQPGSVGTAGRWRPQWLNWASVSPSPSRCDSQFDVVQPFRTAAGIARPVFVAWSGRHGIGVVDEAACATDTGLSTPTRRTMLGFMARPFPGVGTLCTEHERRPPIALNRCSAARAPPTAGVAGSLVSARQRPSNCRARPQPIGRRSRPDRRPDPRRRSSPRRAGSRCRACG